MPTKSRSVTGNHDTAGQVALSRFYLLGSCRGLVFLQVILQMAASHTPLTSPVPLTTLILPAVLVQCAMAALLESRNERIPRSLPRG